jgi:hypothetical protein
MTSPAIQALRAEHSHALDVRSLTEAEWAAQRSRRGVQDVAQHMASTFHSIADPSSIETGNTPDVEQNAEVPVQARRDWSVDEVKAEYREWSEKGIATIAGMQEPPLAEAVVPLGDLGSHPLHLLANAIAFEHYGHLRHDIGTAVRRAADLPHDPSCSRLGGVDDGRCPAVQRLAVRHGVNLVFTDLRTLHGCGRAPSASCGGGPAPTTAADPSRRRTSSSVGPQACDSARTRSSPTRPQPHPRRHQRHLSGLGHGPSRCGLRSAP